jgi:parallel beta-helix repeat protein
MRPTAFFLVAAALFAETSLAQTYVTSDIESDETWIAAHGPYVIQADILVGNYAELTIEPGVTIAFDGDYHLEVGWQSQIFANGTSDHPVIFTSNASNPAMRDWGYVKVLGPQLSTFDHCIFEYADIGVWLSYIDVPISHCVFRESRLGIFCDASSPAILNCTFTQNHVGIYVVNNLSRPVINRCNLFSNSHLNLQVGLYLAPEVTIDATDNWWGTDDANLIAASIHDHHDDERIHAIINFDPWRYGVSVRRNTWGRLKAQYE